jgi:hypothetical protein
VVGTELDHHRGQLVEPEAVGERRLPAIGGEQEHPPPVLGEAERGARRGRNVVALTGLLRHAIDHEQLPPVERRADPLALLGACLIVHPYLIADGEPGQCRRAALAADQNQATVGDRALAGLPAHRGHPVVDHLDLGDRAGALGRAAAAVRAPQRGERLDAAGRQRRLVHPGERNLLPRQGDPTFEEHLADRADAVRGEDRGRAVPRRVDIRRLHQFARADADAQRRIGVVDVKEVPVDRGHRARPARGRGQRLALGHLPGEQIVRRGALGQVDGQAVGLEPVRRAGEPVRSVPVERAQRHAGRDRPLPLRGLDPRLDHGQRARALVEEVVTGIGRVVAGRRVQHRRRVGRPGVRWLDRDDRAGNGEQGEQA